jgi:hypothetical protein
MGPVNQVFTTAVGASAIIAQLCEIALPDANSKTIVEEYVSLGRPGRGEHDSRDRALRGRATVWAARVHGEAQARLQEIR